MPGHWQSRPGGYTLADVVTAGLAYSTDSASKHAHTRTQIAAMQFWVQNGRDCRVEYELPFDVKNEKRECITVCVSSVSS